MATPKSGVSLARDGRPWAGDNGAFTGKFEEDRFFEFLENMIDYQETCLFITCPDVYTDAKKTLERFDKYASKIKNMGYKVAFVCQNGQENYKIPDCDAVFIGGTTKWKLGKHADTCIKEAKSRGLWVHVGRVNTRNRILHFRDADSVDGTCIAFGPDVNIPKILRWIKEAQMQSRLL